jgi:hypothetical protein
VIARPAAHCFQPYGKEDLLITEIDLAAATGLLAARCVTV